jgi:SOS-response transcriptional repressor LexA
MNEKQTVLPTKKQKELLTYIEIFVSEQGYSPSYREIMKGLNYNSVATVALHVNNLIKRGLLQKRDRSARSLAVTSNSEQPSKIVTNQVKPGEERWIIEKVDYFFNQAEKSASPETADIDQLYVLVGALKVLGLDGASQSFIPRLADLRKRLKNP